MKMESETGTTTQNFVKGKVYVFNGVNKRFDGRQMRRLCDTNSCFKLAVGRKMKCKAHGGGKRCTYENCTNSAVDDSLCKRHGGGKRCSLPNCKKSAVGATALCKLHGGGKRCKYDGCTNSAVSRSFCIRHGGGPRCQKPGCTKGARSPHKFCYAHGGGRRCKGDNCNRPATKAGLCSKCSKGKMSVNICQTIPMRKGQEEQMKMPIFGNWLNSSMNPHGSIPALAMPLSMRPVDQQAVYTMQTQGLPIDFCYVPPFIHPGAASVMPIMVPAYVRM